MHASHEENIKTILANAKRAVWEKSVSEIGGGNFKPEEMNSLVLALEERQSLVEKAHELPHADSIGGLVAHLTKKGCHVIAVAQNATTPHCPEFAVLYLQKRGEGHELVCHRAFFEMTTRKWEFQFGNYGDTAVSAFQVRSTKYLEER